MPSRRRLLAAGSALLAGLAGCTDDDPDGPAGAGSPTASASRTSTPSPTDQDPSEGVAWRRDLDGAVKYEPATDDATVYVATNAGTVYAVDHADGRIRWRREFDGSAVGAPSVVGDTLLVFTGPSGSHTVSTHTLLALSTDDGRFQWEFSRNGKWFESVGAANGRVHVGTTNDALSGRGETLYALSIDDGSVAWEVKVGDARGGLAADTGIYVPSYGRIDAFAPDGSDRWTVLDVDYGYRTLTAVGGIVAFVGSPPEEPRESAAYGLDPITGQQRWRIDDFFVTSTTAHGDEFFAGGEHVVAADPRTGEERWRAEAGGSLYESPTVDGLLLAGGINAYRVSDGTREWSFTPDVRFVRPGVAVDGTVFAHAVKSRDDRNRHVYGVNAADGTERWRYVAGTPLTTLIAAGDGAVAGSEGGRLLGFRP